MVMILCYFMISRFENLIHDIDIVCMCYSLSKGSWSSIIYYNITP